MSTKQSSHSLSRRDREILRDVIGTYILTGEPVSSRSMAKLERHGLSSATIRNIMADLEESGYLSQPHTSAGRVPTREGYHFYVESLMSGRRPSARERRYIAENLRGSADAEELVTMTSHLLSELTHQVGIVLTPALGDTVLRTLDFIPLSGSRVLCVVVSASGFVDNKVIELETPLKREELVRISNYLTANFAGKTLRQVREQLLAQLDEERAQVDRWLADAIDLARRAFRAEAGRELVLEGTSALLHQPELADVERVRKVLDTFSDRARLVQMLTRLIQGRGVRVLIGEDSDLTSDLDFSLVATTYGVGEKPLGTLGILGPSRMQYQRIVPLVHYLGETLGRALEETMRDGPERDDGGG